MKWFLFFVLAMFLFSCKNENMEKPVKKIVPLQSDSSSTGNSGLSLEIIDISFGHDTGYFKNKSIASVKSIGYPVNPNNAFDKFLIANIDTVDIDLHNKYALMHSCRISGDTTIRIDTLTGEAVTIIQKVNLKKDKLISLTINGRLVDTNTDDILDYDADSFRDFSFKGNDFYYLASRIIGSSGGSAGLIIYHLLYNKKYHIINTFTTFRVDGYNFLGDADNDDRLDFLNVENEGGYGIDTINQFKINIYSSNNRTGIFELLKDKYRKEYFVEGNSNTSYYIGESMNITKSYWPKPIK